MRYYARRRRNDRIGIALIVIVFLLILAAMPIAFRWLDCNNARSYLEFYDACIADENCTLTGIELRRLNSYTRLEIRSCDRKD